MRKFLSVPRRRHPEPDHVLFGAVLRTKREELGFSQLGLGAQLNRSQAWVSRYELAYFRKIPTLLDLRLLCWALSLNPVELLYECKLIDRGEVQEFARHLDAIDSFRKAA